MITFQIYLSIAQVHFVDLTMHWYGGETTMITHVGEEKNINFRFNIDHSILTIKDWSLQKASLLLLLLPSSLNNLDKGEDQVH